jgi:hypothetical protein
MAAAVVRLAGCQRAIVVALHSRAASVVLTASTSVKPKLNHRTIQPLDARNSQMVIGLDGAMVQ